VSGAERTRRALNDPIHEIGIERLGEVEVVRVTGEIDLSNAVDLTRALESTSSARVVLDLGMLTYIDSSGIRAIDAGFRALARQERSFKVVVPTDTPAHWIFRVTGLADELVADDLESALAALASGGG
jgi:anti-anti-sigma factor